MSVYSIPHVAQAVFCARHSSTYSSAGSEKKGSCTRALRIIISPPKPGKMPQLNPFWRGQGHGVTPVLLPTRSVGSHLALRHVASQLAQAKRDPAPRPTHTHK